MRNYAIALLAGAACLAFAFESQADQPQPQPQPPAVNTGPPQAQGRVHHGQAGQLGPHQPPSGPVGGQPSAQPHFGRAPQSLPGGAVPPAHPSPPPAGAPPQFQHQPGELPHRGPQPGGQPAPAFQPVVPQPGARPPLQQRPGEFEHRAPTPQPTAPRPGAPSFNPPPGIPRLGDWSRDLRGDQRDAAGRQWRNTHRDWDRNAPWRHDRDWWRGNSAFRLFLGPRLGFFFIPELGYIAAPPEYENHDWRAGDRLPRWFWRYTVEDYWKYGLPAPPYGCAWVWVGRDVALIDLGDGYILDIVRNVW